MRLKRPRTTILGGLIAIAFIAMGLGLYVQNLRINRLRAELQEARARTRIVMLENIEVMPSPINIMPDQLTLILDSPELRVRVRNAHREALQRARMHAPDLPGIGEIFAP